MDVTVGQRIIVEGEFRLAGVAKDPLLVRFFMRGPSGALITIAYPDNAVVRRSTGRYEASVVVDVPGTWYFRWEGSGVIDAVEELTVPVRGSNVLQSA